MPASYSIVKRGNIGEVLPRAVITVTGREVPDSIIVVKIPALSIRDF